jgi:SAM-dependent methyltransferase
MMSMTGLTYKAKAKVWIDRLRGRLHRPIATRHPSLRQHIPRFRPIAFDHHQDYVDHLTKYSLEYQSRKALLAKLVTGERPIVTEGYCICCSQPRGFLSDPVAQGHPPEAAPDWREGVICPGCSLNSRMRASIHLMLWALKPAQGSGMYLTEQYTPLFHWVKLRYPMVVGSEYLRDGTAKGQTNAGGVRHEDLTALSFPDASLNSIVSFEVMEHIPNYRAAFAECARVLVPGGKLLLSAPFYRGPKHLLRASLRPDGSIEHHLPPEYHGDPLDPQGCLCFHHFNWDIVDFLRQAGFRRATAYSIWSRELGYLAAEGDIFLFIAVK